MRIVNPRSSVGNLPLATTWYVDTQVEAASADLSEALNIAISGVNDKIAFETAERKLYDKAVTNTFARYITGDTNHKSDEVSEEIYGIVENYIKPYLEDGILKSGGYAWLTNNKVDPSLLPDLAISTPVPVNRSTINTWFISAGGADNGSELSIALDQLGSDEERAEYVIEQFVCKARLNEDGTLGDKDGVAPVKTGDMVIVLCDDGEDTYIENKRTYLGKRYLGGAWAVISNEPTVSASLVKISFSQGEIIEINGKHAAADGSLHLALSDIYKYDEDYGSTESIGIGLARDILAVSGIPASAVYDSTSAIPGLTSDGVRFAYRQHSGVASDEYIPYATLKEVSELNDYVYDTINTAVGELSGQIDYISGRIGNVDESVVLSANTITDAIDTISGKVAEEINKCDTISGALNGKAVQIITTNISWLDVVAEEAEEDIKAVYPSGEFIGKYVYGGNGYGTISGKVLAVYEVDSANNNIEKAVQPDIEYHANDNTSVITMYDYIPNSVASGFITETSANKTWKVYSSLEINF